MTPRVLVIEDESALATLLTYNLEQAGFSVRVAATGEDALTILAEDPPDIVLIDWMLPHVSGIEICRRIRRGGQTADLPVIMLTARSEEADRIRGLDTGADDYVTKPFSPAELVARINALLRRARPALSADELRAGDVVMDLAAHRVRVAGQEVELGPTEFRLLRYFLENPGRVYSRDQILDAVWGRDIHVADRTVDVHIGRLRKALRTAAGSDPIRTIRGTGYALETDGA
ncbi:MAG: phosphate regulon transcriptional regulator PhoB [Alphaproteobacteria bacterium]|nr:phosphate regulon transcriptional regulator PhoB [Alphaproteobacteria bacterium]